MLFLFLFAFPGPDPDPDPARAGMARSTLSSRFRRLDIDQYDENRFVEEPEEAAAAEPDASPEVEALLRQYPLGRGTGVPGGGGGTGPAPRAAPAAVARLCPGTEGLSP
ncbi:hypothetical protein BTVI_03526 [Pitangus sulphuratus]|nr:hypothetical protein BTVI_03526 [Pitangus sulphuratus]